MGNGPFIDGLPNLKMVIFHGYVTNNQRVYYTHVTHEVLVIQLFPVLTTRHDAVQKNTDRSRWRRAVNARRRPCAWPPPG